MTDTTITLGELETVPQNLFGISPVTRERPYLGNAESQKAYMKFLGYERSVLTSRIAELNSRADQIMYIWLCRKNKAYLAVADRTTTTSRTDDSYFYEWIDELAIRGVAYASKRKNPRTGKPMYRWDEIEKVVNLCLSKGLPIEIAAKVASVGVNAVDKYLKYGIISLDDMIEGKLAIDDSAVPAIEEPVKNDRGETEADILIELAQATSSRGASMIAKDRVGTDYVRVSAMIREKGSDLSGFDRYSVEAQIVNRSTGEYTPYETRFYTPCDMPMQAVKFMLSKWSEALSRII